MLFRSKYAAPLKQSIMSSIRGNGNLYLIVILLIALESIHFCHSPPFLGAKTVGIAQGLKLSLINPLSNSSFTYFLISSLSLGLIRYAALFGKLALGIKSM